MYLYTVTVIINCMVHTFIVPWHYYSPPTGRFHRRGLALAFLCVRQSVRQTVPLSVSLEFYTLFRYSFEEWYEIYWTASKWQVTDNVDIFVASGWHMYEKIRCYFDRYLSGEWFRTEQRKLFFLNWVPIYIVLQNDLILFMIDNFYIILFKTYSF